MFFLRGRKKWNSEPCFFTKSVGRRFQELSFGVSGCKLGDLAREMGPRAWFLKNKGKKLKKLLKKVKKKKRKKNEKFDEIGQKLVSGALD